MPVSNPKIRRHLVCSALNIDFATRQEALSIVNSLPPEIIAAGPFAQSSLAVQREILVTDENN